MNQDNSTISSFKTGLFGANNQIQSFPTVLRSSLGRCKFPVDLSAILTPGNVWSYTGPSSFLIDFLAVKLIPTPLMGVMSQQPLRSCPPFLERPGVCCRCPWSCPPPFGDQLAFSRAVSLASIHSRGSTLTSGLSADLHSPRGHAGKQGETRSALIFH